MKKSYLSLVLLATVLSSNIIMASRYDVRGFLNADQPDANGWHEYNFENGIELGLTGAHIFGVDCPPFDPCKLERFTGPQRPLFIKYGENDDYISRISHGTQTQYVVKSVAPYCTCTWFMDSNTEYLENCPAYGNKDEFVKKMNEWVRRISDRNGEVIYVSMLWPGIAKVLKELVKNRNLLVIAAGNHGQKVDEVSIRLREELDMLVEVNNNPEYRGLVIIAGASKGMVVKPTEWTVKPTAKTEKWFVWAWGEGIRLPTLMPIHNDDDSISVLTGPDTIASSGTSFAAPAIAAILAALKEGFPGIPLELAHTALKASCVRQGEHLVIPNIKDAYNFLLRHFNSIPEEKLSDLIREMTKTILAENLWESLKSRVDFLKKITIGNLSEKDFDDNKNLIELFQSILECRPAPVAPDSAPVASAPAPVASADDQIEQLRGNLLVDFPEIPETIYSQLLTGVSGELIMGEINIIEAYIRSRDVVTLMPTQMPEGNLWDSLGRGVDFLKKITVGNLSRPNSWISLGKMQEVLKKITIGNLSKEEFKANKILINLINNIFLNRSAEDSAQVAPAPGWYDFRTVATVAAGAAAVVALLAKSSPSDGGKNPERTDSSKN